MTKIQLYGYEEILDSLVSSVKLFKDPLETGTPLLYDNNVYESFPGRSRTSTYSGIMAVVALDDIPTITGVGERIATFTGRLFTLIPGSDASSIRKCLRYCDINRGYLESLNLLNLPGVFTKIQDSYPNRFTGLNLSELLGTKQPIHVRAGMTAFIVERELDETVYEL